LFQGVFLEPEGGRALATAMQPQGCDFVPLFSASPR
jgi:hypothetical protein